MSFSPGDTCCKLEKNEIAMNILTDSVKKAMYEVKVAVSIVNWEFKVNFNFVSIFIPIKMCTKSVKMKWSGIYIYSEASKFEAVIVWMFWTKLDCPYRIW